MIVSIEGPSAAGKTTWCRAQAREFVAEYQPTGLEPDGHNLDHQAQYWVAVNSGRWSQAEQLEKQAGIAFCDSDPLKLHYSWCLARVGAAPRERFEQELAASLDAFDNRALGFADSTFISVPPFEVLDRHRENDAARSRRHFALHAKLAEPLTEWYSAVESIDPGRVIWRFPAQVDPAALPPPRSSRSNADLLRAVVAELPGLGST